MFRKILVTAALPYANGDIHLGHLVEYLQADFWVRFQKMRGNDCHYMCADDTHGTPIMISAREKGIKPEELIDHWHKEHYQDFKNFEIEFDNYYTTNSPENKELSVEIYNKLLEKGHIEERPIKQLFCENDMMFLPDRFVKGECPSCKAEDQYGDSCDVCSTTYSPTSLKKSTCTLCGNKPIEKESSHIFVKLNHFKKFLKGWVKKHTSKEVQNKLHEWLDHDLRDWDISRDAPYFGFEIPGKPGKYFYVWLDAPIGYIAATKNWCEKHGRNYQEFWKSKESEIYHFIGKDIVYFHTLFWPAMLNNAEYSTPDKVFVHGFLTVNGEKMSKSKGTLIKAKTYLKHLNPDYLRYYYAAKMSSSIDDIDLNLDDFVLRVNSELVGKITNLASRSIQILKKIGLTLGNISPEGQKLIKQAQDKADIIAKYYEERDFFRAMMEIRSLAESTNKHIDTAEPWKVIKNDPEKARDILTTIVNIFRLLAIYLKPILPSYVKKVEELLQDPEYTWDSLKTTIEKKEINAYKNLANRMDPKIVQKMLEDSLATTEKKPAKVTGTGIIEITDVTKVDLRVAKIIKAEDIPEANKLLKLTISLGDKKRTIFAGIKKYYTTEQLINKLIIVVANLKPRKMKFGTSSGMLLAASSKDKKSLFLITPDPGAEPGQKIS